MNFENVKNFVIFVGYGKSGTTLVGSLLDAHPNAIVTYEYNVLGVIEENNAIKREDLFNVLLKKSSKQRNRRKIGDGYTYKVQNGWQGKCENLKVIGDKKAGTSTRYLQNNPKLIDKLRKVIGDTGLKVLFVTRNPFDVISTTYYQQKRKDNKTRKINRQWQVDGECVDAYFSCCATVKMLKEKAIIKPEELFQVKHEHIIDNPKSKLAEICNFLELEPENNYINACTETIYKKPHKSREEIFWSAKNIKKVAARAKSFDFIAEYAWDN